MTGWTPRRTLAVVLGGLLLASLPLADPIAEPASALSVNTVTRVAKLTGADSMNSTDTKYAVQATDLGTMWDNGNGQVLMAFGDTYGEGWGGNGAGPRTADWRCNVLARSTDSNLSDGLTFQDMVVDSPGHAKQILPCKKITNDEETVIPTAGIAVGGRQYLHYMSVNRWGAAGSWYTNYGGFAYSDDNGTTWTKHASARWVNDSTWSNKFQMAALVRAGGYVYMFGTPNGRFGGVRLARVPEAEVLTKTAWRYWDGTGWVATEGAAAVVAAAPVGELSVAYNSKYNRWLMTYLDEDRGAIVLREAPSVVGPWSGAQVLADKNQYPDLYGAYIHPWTNGGDDLYFAMSQWVPYNVYLMRATLSGTANDNVVSDGGFEEQPGSAVSAPWGTIGTTGIDRNGLSRSGAANAWLRSTSGYNDVYQTVAVQPGSRYRLVAWVRTSANPPNGYVGARQTDGTVITERRFGALPGYTQLTVDFDTGSRSLVDVFVGFWADGDTWAQVDDVSLMKL